MSDETSYLLEEYKELGLSWRRDSDALVKMETIFIPLSIAALTLPYYLKVEIPKLLSVSGGLMLMVYWFIMVCLYMRKLDSWLPRMREIEEILGFDSQRRYHSRRNEANHGVIDKGLNFRRLRLFVFVLYVIITLPIMLDLQGSIDTSNWGIIKFVIAAETIVYFYDSYGDFNRSGDHILELLPLSKKITSPENKCKA